MTSVAIVTNFVGSLRGLRTKFDAHHDLLRTLVPITVGGPLAGCALLLESSPSTIARVALWLIGAATPLDVARSRWVSLSSLFGDNVGAGIGISLLAAKWVSALVITTGLVKSLKLLLQNWGAIPDYFTRI